MVRAPLLRRGFGGHAQCLQVVFPRFFEARDQVDDDFQEVRREQLNRRLEDYLTNHDIICLSTNL